VARPRPRRRRPNTRASECRSDRTRRSAWTIFSGLCRTVSVKGGLVTDAYFAALAIESGSEWITTDPDYSRFPGLRWRHPIKS